MKRLAVTRRGPVEQVVSVCPGFVNSAMVPDRPIARFISRFFFSCRAATLAPITALLDPALQGGEWVTNFQVLWTHPAHPLFRGMASLLMSLGLRDLWISLLATPQVVLFQNASYAAPAAGRPGTAASLRPSTSGACAKRSSTVLILTLPAASERGVA